MGLQDRFNQKHEPPFRLRDRSSSLSEKHASGAGPATWTSLPRKDQLLLLFLARFVDFLQIASLQAYVFYQLKSYRINADGTTRRISDAEIATQAGVLQGCFTGTQVLTAMMWGKAADASWCGRKTVLLVGLGGTAISCLGFGFATSFRAAAFWRAFGGAINGTVGIIRTMVAEITKEKKFQSRAFLILPRSFNVAGILGPVMGGLLADPARTLPGVFGEGAILHFSWIKSYPYALPSLCNAIFLANTALLVFLFLEETHKVRRNEFDAGLHMASWFKQNILGRRAGYMTIPTIDISDAPSISSGSESEKTSPQKAGPPRSRRALPFHMLWTRNVVLTLFTGAFYDFHLGAFTNLWSLFLSTPRSASAPALPYAFTGGLGMSAATVGFATSILGLLGMLLQIFLYPPVHARLGTLRSFQWFLLLFPVAYVIAPYLAVLPSGTAAPDPASGAFIWTGIVLVLLLQVTARTFTLPASIILLNNCSPHPSVLGTIHGLGQSVSAGFRTVGPIVSGWWYGIGLNWEVVGFSWWATTLVSVLGSVVAVWLYEGSGHEIFLEGEREETQALTERRREI